MTKEKESKLGLVLPAVGAFIGVAIPVVTFAIYMGDRMYVPRAELETLTKAVLEIKSDVRDLNTKLDLKCPSQPALGAPASRRRSN